MRALVVDDSSAMRAFIKRVLLNARYAVSEAGDGAHALRLLNDDQRFDVAFLDVNMPGVNGLETLAHLRTDHRFNSMRIVMATTETERDRVAHALQNGADEYVMKPFSPESVLQKLEMLGLGHE